MKDTIVRKVYRSYVGFMLAGFTAIMLLVGCTSQRDEYGEYNNPQSYLPPAATNIAKIDKNSGTFEMKTPDGVNRKFLYVSRDLGSNYGIFSITELK